MCRKSLHISEERLVDELCLSCDMEYFFIWHNGFNHHKAAVSFWTIRAESARVFLYNHWLSRTVSCT